MYKNLALLVILSFMMFPGGKKPTSRLPTSEIQEPVQGLPSQSEGGLFEAKVKPPEAEITDADTENSSISQNESNTVNVGEQTKLTDPEKLILYMRIIKPCPNIDYKMRVFTPGLNMDPGIWLGGPGNYTVVPGDIEQDCDQVSTINDSIGK
jgi:hypothetical protein